VDSSKEMLGTFSPQPEAYTHEMPEETTPSGLFARGSYSARSKVILFHIPHQLRIKTFYSIQVTTNLIYKSIL